LIVLTGGLHQWLLRPHPQDMRDAQGVLMRTG
jgi:hypothetical protein